MTAELTQIRDAAGEIVEFVHAWLHGDISAQAKIIGHAGGIKAMCDRIERQHEPPSGDAYEMPVRVRRVAELTGEEIAESMMDGHCGACAGPVAAELRNMRRESEAMLVESTVRDGREA